jgi:hypothetical protein
MLLAILQASLGENSTVGFCTPPYRIVGKPRGMGLDRQITTAQS